MDGSLYLADVVKRFRDAQKQCDRAIAQVPFERWNHRLDPESNSIVTLMLHLSGNMLSRWSGFLTSDGEKPDRNRDAEFEDPETLSQDALLARWASGWSCLFDAMSGLTEADLDRTITIRAQPLSVVEAINRQVAHYAQHAGQLVFLCKHLAGGQWKTMSIARRGSDAFNAAMETKRPS
ncbi:MAG: DUF1572 family protein [Acidobacteriota bacterium]